jgi:type II secretory pathway pseudopilin PulG
MGIALMAVGQSWSITMKREREAELLFRGRQIQAAIERYAADYEVRKGTRDNIYPLRLAQLADGPKRYLPRIYRDPVSGRDFDVIEENGEIHGVRSPSTERPLDRVHFREATTYQEIRFKARRPQDFEQACRPDAPAINPLNPLMARPCQPGSVSRPGTTEPARSPSDSFPGDPEPQP